MRTTLAAEEAFPPWEPQRRASGEIGAESSACDYHGAIVETPQRLVSLRLHAGRLERGGHPGHHWTTVTATS